MHTRFSLPLVLAVWITCLAPGAAAQKLSLDQVIDSLFAVHGFRQVAISPDGRRVAWVESLKAGTRSRRATRRSMWRLSALPNGRAASLPGRATTMPSTTSPGRRTAASWLSFRTRKSDQLQLYVAEAPGTARQLTHFAGFLASPSWSPDGKRLALLFTENAPRAAGPLEADDSALRRHRASTSTSSV